MTIEVEGLKGLPSYIHFEKVERPEITYSLIKKNSRVYLYLNVGGKSVRIASISVKYFEDVMSFAAKLAKKIGENQAILNEENGDKLLIFMRVRPIISYDRIVRLKKVITSLESTELWFWAWKMRVEPRRAPSAFVKLYGV